MAKQLLVLMLVVMMTSLWSDTARAESPNDLLIIANMGIPFDTIDSSDLRIVFLKKREFVGGKRIVPINASDSKLRKTFQKKVLSMNDSEEKRYWQEQKVVNGIDPPASFITPLKAVFKIKGGISYVFRKDYKEGVAKVLLVIPNDA